MGLVLTHVVVMLLVLSVFGHGVLQGQNVVRDIGLVLLRFDPFLTDLGSALFFHSLPNVGLLPSVFFPFDCLQHNSNNPLAC